MKIFDYKKNPDLKLEFYLKLEEFDGKVALVAVDKNGNSIEHGNILVITDTHIELCGEVNPKLGFNRVSEGDGINTVELYPATRD